MPYLIEPEVSGQLGEKTIIDISVDPPNIKVLHFVFYGWLGDDLIESFPVYLISDKLNLKITRSNLTGYFIQECDIEISDEFKMLQPNIPLPKFYWFNVNWSGLDDFQIQNKRLLVSDTAYSILSTCNVKNAVIKRN